MLRTLYRLTSFGLSLLIVSGVSDVDEVKSVSVMEGDSVTLHTDVTHTQREDYILWTFGPQDARLAEMQKKSIDLLNGSKIFGDWRLWLDRQTGSLTIKNIRTTHTGLYTLLFLSERGNAYMQFNVTVYAPLSNDSNHIQHHNITEFCWTCSENLSKAIPIAINSFVLVVLAAGLYLLCRKCKKASTREVQKEEEEVYYMDTKFCEHNEQTKAHGKEETIYSNVATRL